MRILIDNREKGAYLHFLSHYQDLTIVRKTLPSGDVLIGDLGVERKLIPDLFLTLNEGRLFKQLLKLKKTYQRHLLLIEGGSHSSEMWNDRLLGLMTRLMAGWQIPILWSNKPKDTAAIIHRIVYQESFASAGPISFRPRTKAERELTPAVKALAQVSGIGHTKACSLLRYFGTLDGVFGASRSELEKVSGIGRVRAQQIWDANRSSRYLSGPHSS